MRKTMLAALMFFIGASLLPAAIVVWSWGVPPEQTATLRETAQAVSWVLGTGTIVYAVLTALVLKLQLARRLAWPSLLVGLPYMWGIVALHYSLPHHYGWLGECPSCSSVLYLVVYSLLSEVGLLALVLGSHGLVMLRTKRVT